MSYSVIGYIPWFSPYKSSKMGGEPEPDGGFNLILWLLCMTNPILNNILAMAMAMTGGEIFAYLKEYCENVLMNVLTTVGDLLWTLIRAAILILIYVLFALAFLMINIAIGILLGVFLVLNLFLNIEMSLEINNISTNGDFNMEIGYEVSQEYNEFFDLYAPTIETYLVSNGFALNFKLNHFIATVEVGEFPDNILGNLKDDPPDAPEFGLQASSTTYFNITNTWLLNLFEIISNIGDGTGQCGAVLTILSASTVLMVFATCGSDYLGLVIALGILFVEVTTFIIATFLLETDESRKSAALLGLGIGYLISGIFTLIGASGLVGVAPGATTWFSSTMGTHFEKLIVDIYIRYFIDLPLTIFGIEVGLLESVQELPDSDLYWLIIESSTSLFGGIAGLILGISSTVLIPGTPSKFLFTYVTGLVFMMIGLIVIGIGIHNF